MLLFFSTFFFFHVVMLIFFHLPVLFSSYLLDCFVFQPYSTFSYSFSYSLFSFLCSSSKMYLVLEFLLPFIFILLPLPSNCLLILQSSFQILFNSPALMLSASPSVDLFHLVAFPFSLPYFICLLRKIKETVFLEWQRHKQNNCTFEKKPVFFSQKWQTLSKYCHNILQKKVRSRWGKFVLLLR